MTKTITKNTKKATSVVDTARVKVAGKLIHLVSRGNRRAFGTMPLEWPMNDPVTGKRAVDSDEKDRDGNVVNQIRYPNLEWGVSGVIAFNPNDRDDAAMLARVREWLANSGDKRIARYGIELIENGNVEASPFPRYEQIKADVVAEMICNMLGEDDAANREFLEACARYELQMDSPRDVVLDALADLGTDTGDESGDGVVVES